MNNSQNFEYPRLTVYQDRVVTVHVPNKSNVLTDLISARHLHRVNIANGQFKAWDLQLQTSLRVFQVSISPLVEIWSPAIGFCWIIRIGTSDVGLGSWRQEMIAVTLGPHVLWGANVLLNYG